MVPGGLTRRYSKALFDLCEDSKTRGNAHSEMKAFLDVYNANAELREVVKNPAFAANEKKATMTAVFEALKLSDLSTRFFTFLLERGRLDCVGGIAEDFGHRLDQEMGRVRVELISALALTPAELKRAEAALTKLTGSKDIVVDCTVDPSVLGGVITRIGNTVFDSSIRNQIENMREHLLAG
jgi:F-type H+-transporting ATPase subunit delta